MVESGAGDIDSGEAAPGPECSCQTVSNQGTTLVLEIMDYCKHVSNSRARGLSSTFKVCTD